MFWLSVPIDKSDGGIAQESRLPNTGRHQHTNTRRYRKTIRLALEATVEPVVEVLVGRSLRPLLVGRLLTATIATGARGPGIAHRRLATICRRGLGRRTAIVTLLLTTVLTYTFSSIPIMA